MKYAKSIAGVLLALGSALGWAGSTDLQFAPASSAGHDFNHAPVGQSFVALAAQVKAGIFIADEDSFTSWLQQTYAGLSPFPYAIAPSVTIRVQLLTGEGIGGTELDSRNITLNKPFMGFVDVDYAAAGVSLVPGQKYTLLMTDISGQSYPNGVTGWVVPSVTDPGTGASLPPGAYAYGQPILQGALVTDDAGIGDNAFEVLDVGATAPAPLVVSGTLPYGQTGTPYAATLTASGGLAPYRWDATGLPAGLGLDAATGTISGTPTLAGTFKVNVTVYDDNGAADAASYDVVISYLSCTRPKTAKASKGRGTVTAVGAGHVMVGSKHIDYAGCSNVNYGGYANAPAVGDRVEWQGFLEPNGYVMAQTLTFN
jgi:hypothetical protein